MLFLAGSLHMWISNVHPPHSLAFASSQEAVSHRITWLMNEGGYTDVTSTPQLCTDLPKLAGRQGCNSRTLCALLTSLDIANGMRVLHESNTLHQNLTTHNVLLFTSHKVCHNCFPVEQMSLSVLLSCMQLLNYA